MLGTQFTDPASSENKHLSVLYALLSFIFLQLKCGNQLLICNFAVSMHMMHIEALFFLSEVKGEGKCLWKL